MVGKKRSGADGVEEAVAAEAVLDRALGFGEGQGHVLLAQLLEQPLEGVGGGGRCRGSP
jgi:hypothetical protein